MRRRRFEKEQQRDRCAQVSGRAGCIRGGDTAGIGRARRLGGCPVHADRRAGQPGTYASQDHPARLCRSAGSPIFSVGTQQSAASRPQNRTIPPAFLGRDREDNPGQQGQSRDPGPATGSGTSSDDDRSRRANATVHEHDALASQLAAQAAASALAAEWRAAGLGRHDRHIIEQCQRHGLTPQDVRVRVDGQTIASRLKNGESISSVRSRIGQAT